MTDDVTVGLLSILGTAIGVFLGFGLTKLNDSITAKRKLRTYQIQLMQRLMNVEATIRTLEDFAKKLDKITTKNDLESFQKILVMTEIKDELKKIETLLEKFTLPDFNKSTTFSDFAILKVNINNLLIDFSQNTENFADIKPELISNLKSCNDHIQAIKDTINL